MGSNRFDRFESLELELLEQGIGLLRGHLSADYHVVLNRLVRELGELPAQDGPGSRLDFETQMRMAGVPEPEIEETRTWPIDDVASHTKLRLWYLEKISPPRNCSKCESAMRHFGGARSDAYWLCDCGYREEGL